MEGGSSLQAPKEESLWQHVLMDPELLVPEISTSQTWWTDQTVKIREGVSQGGVISPTLFIIFIDDICGQLSSHIPRALHADDLALWTKAEQVITAAIRMQEAMNLNSDWAKEWLVIINRTKTEATYFSLSPKREEFILQINGQEIHQQDTPT